MGAQVPAFIRAPLGHTGRAPLDYEGLGCPAGSFLNLLRRLDLQPWRGARRVMAGGGVSLGAGMEVDVCVDVLPGREQGGELVELGEHTNLPVGWC